MTQFGLYQGQGFRDWLSIGVGASAKRTMFILQGIEHVGFDQVVGCEIIIVVCYSLYIQGLREGYRVHGFQIHSRILQL